MPFTYGRPGGCATIDFVWASDALGVHGVMKPMGAAAAANTALKGIPDRTWPSDHLPLGVVLRLRTGCASDE